MNSLKLRTRISGFIKPDAANFPHIESGTPRVTSGAVGVFVELSNRVEWAVNRAVDGWVHASVGDDPFLRGRHRSLIASHLLGGLLSALVFAAYFAWTGAPSAAAVIASVCFVAQIGIATTLSRSGDLELSHLLSAGNLTAIVTVAAGLSGGTSSFAIAWLILVPLEAALSADRRLMIIATGLALLSLGGLHAVTVLGLLPTRVSMPIDSELLTLITFAGGIAYAGGLVASVQDMHRGAAREVEAGRELYRLIAENANDLITRHDAIGRVTFASIASRTLFGIEPYRLLGPGFQPLLAPADWDRHTQSLTRCLAEGVPVSQEFEIARRRADGTGTEQIWIEMRCQPVAPLPGQAAGSIIAVARDITVRKSEAIELARARDEAERASRAKTAFLATMSHELRTPLNAIIGFAEILHRDLLIKARDPKQADHARIIHQSGEHLLSLVKDLLDVSKIESGKFSVVADPFALDEVVPMAVDTMKPLALSKGIMLACELEADLPDLLADRRAVRQILINLVSNACKFTPAGGTVTVSARRIGDTIELAVTDTGIGIDPSHIAKLGQPFYQIDTRYARQNEGAGLGLCIVRGLVDLHDGSFTIDSTPGQGSRFAVTLAADTANAEPIAEAPAKLQKVAVVIDLAEIHHRRQLQQRPDACAAAAAKPLVRAGAVAGKTSSSIICLPEFVR